ncbi:hypothetical protein Hdeb2414_s0009g00307491 [Helianthus debilis subsp. tardiflorus]
MDPCENRQGRNIEANVYESLIGVLLMEMRVTLDSSYKCKLGCHPVDSISFNTPSSRSYRGISSTSF